MNYLFWDDALASVAQAYSEKCIWAHNANRASDVWTYQDEATFKFDNYSLSVGENIYATTASYTNDSLIAGITDWYNEYSLYTYSDPFTFSDSAGHYTQVVWAETRYVGCGYTVCPTLTNLAYDNALFLVCDYYPAGNVESGVMYETGTACASCPSDRTSCTDGLCSGCPSPWYNYCSDYYSNCASQLASDCPSNCNLTSTNYLCTGCRTTCSTCSSSLLESPSSCTDGTGDSNYSGAYIPKYKFELFCILFIFSIIYY